MRKAPPPNGDGASQARLAIGELREELREVGLDGGLRLGADHGLDDLATAEYLHRGDGGDLVLHREIGVLVDVELENRDLLGVLGLDLVGRSYLLIDADTMKCERLDT